METKKFDEMITEYNRLKKLCNPDWVRIEDEENLVFEFKLK